MKKNEITVEAGESAEIEIYKSQPSIKFSG